jgi:GAF domain-containing protein
MNEKLTGSVTGGHCSREKHEVVRQAAVYASGVLSMGGDPAMYQLVEQAAREFHVPMAAVSVVDRDRQWFPVSIGMDVGETAREVSFCAHAIEQPHEILTVLDASHDPRFCANPLVTGESHIRFYLGCPILDRSGLALGSLCVIDVQPRERVETAQYERLRELAQEAANIIAYVEVSTTDLKHAGDSIGEQIEDLVRAGEESVVSELDAMLRRIERQEEKLRRQQKGRPASVKPGAA